MYTQVIKMIDSGYRLPPPPGCPRALYNIMIACWYVYTCIIGERNEFSVGVRWLLAWLGSGGGRLYYLATIIGGRKGAGAMAPYFFRFYIAPPPHFHTKLMVCPPHFEFTSSAYDNNNTPCTINIPTPPPHPL